MTLISLLLVLAADRMITKTEFWRSEFYLKWYSNLLRERGWFMQEDKPWLLYASILVPALLCGYLLSWFDSTLITLVINLVLLMIAVGCPHLRDNYKGYLQASNRGDFAARDLYAEQLGYNHNSELSFGQYILWVNFQHYFAVAFWFALFGAPGAMLYVLARHMRQQQVCQWSNGATKDVMFVLNWLPARVAGLGFLMVGDFTRGFPVWLSQAANLKNDGQTVLTKVAKASEEIEPNDTDCTEEPCTLLRLGKRNMVMLLAAMAVLTLGGWLH